MLKKWTLVSKMRGRWAGGKAEGAILVTSCTALIRATTRSLQSRLFTYSDENAVVKTLHLQFDIQRKGNTFEHHLISVVVGHLHLVKMPGASLKRLIYIVLHGGIKSSALCHAPP